MSQGWILLSEYARPWHMRLDGSRGVSMTVMRKVHVHAQIFRPCPFMLIIDHAHRAVHTQPVPLVTGVWLLASSLIVQY